ncbi:MAG: hypothetical protein ABII27_00930 [bacterium]
MIKQMIKKINEVGKNWLMRLSLKRLIVSSLVISFALIANAMAWDNLRLSGPTKVLETKTYVFTVMAYTGGVFDNTASVNIEHDPQSGITVIYNNGKTLINGTLDVQMKFSNPNTYWPVFYQKDNLPEATLPYQVECFGLVKYFTVPIPANIEAGVPFNATISAKAIDGTIVEPFDDMVEISCAVGEIRDFVGGSVDNTFIDGSEFVDGVADVQLVLYGGSMDNANNLVPRENNIYVNNTINYGFGIAHGETGILTVDPGSFDSVVMLFPGETLVTGVLSGLKKTGTPNQAYAGIPVDVVEVWAIDSWGNPVDGGPYPNVSFTSSYNTPPNDDVLPAGGNLGANYKEYNSVFMIRKVDVGVSHIITVTESINSNTNITQLPVIAAGVSEFRFYDNIDAINPPDRKLRTTDTFGLYIEAVDGSGNIKFSYNQTLNLFCKELPTANIVDTDTSDDIPQSQITFVNGRWPAVGTQNVRVTKVQGNIHLKIEDSLGNTGENAEFDVIAGARAKLLLTLEGETFTSGVYPGNAGVPTEDFAAGSSMSVDVRVVDKYWNLVPGSDIDDVKLLADDNCYIQFSPASRTIGAGGELEDAFNVTFRTAGTQVLKVGAEAPFGGPYDSTPLTVYPGAYDDVVLVSPGETLAPGIPTAIESDGKLGDPSNQNVSNSFGVTVYAVDQYFNPVANPPYPTIRFTTTDPLGVIPTGNIDMGNDTEIYAIQLNTYDPVDQVKKIKVEDVSDPAGKKDEVYITVVPGAVASYVVEVHSINVTKNVGVPFTITLTAKDPYGNTAFVNSDLDLQLSVGTDVINPGTITLNNGVWSGDIRSFASGNGVILSVADQDPVPQVGYSNPFNIRAGNYTKLLLLLAGEEYKQGQVIGKAGAPTATTCGNEVTATIMACDYYSNPVQVFPTVELVPDNIVQFMENPITINTANGTYITSLVLKNAVSHTIYVRDVNNDTTIGRSSSTVTGTAGAYKKVLILAPGQSSDPGTAFGRAGDPDQQEAGIPFEVTVLAVDDYWNKITDMNSGQVTLSSSDDSIAINPPVNQGDTFVNGEIKFTIHLGSQGNVTVSVTDASNATIIKSKVNIQVTPGAVYSITTPESVLAGKDFIMDVKLINTETGLPGDFDHTFYMQAVFPNGEPASGLVAVDNSILTDGTVTIDNQKYDYVEDIKIRITDSYSRSHYSDIISVNPNGLRYEITVPETATAGPPSKFSVTIELREKITDTIVKSMDHTVAIETLSASTGLTGAGESNVTEVVLSDGITIFNQTYTKAENIFLKATDKNNTTGFNPIRASSIIEILPDTYKKLQIVAPGEVVLPGVPSSTGKDSTNITKQKNAEPFTVSIRSVDQYWNLVTFNEGSIHLTSEDGSLDAANPPNQGASFVNGGANFLISIYSAGNIKVTCEDKANPAKDTQSVYIPVSGAYYEVSMPTAAFSGPPSTFAMTVRLKDSDSGSIISSNNSIFLTALLPSRSSNIGGVLQVTQVNLINGIANINDQAYNVAEDIIIMISDSYNRKSFSNVIEIWPLAVNLNVIVPETATVGPPATFSVSIQVIDKFTGNIVPRYNTSFNLEAISARDGLRGEGQLSVHSVEISKGELSFTQSYTKAETIYLRATSNDFDTANSNNIVMLAGAPTKMIMEKTTEMEAGQAQDIYAMLTDQYENPVPGEVVQFEFNSLYDGVFLSADKTVTDNDGKATVQLIAQPTARSLVVVRAWYKDLTISKKTDVTIKGMPVTDLMIVNGIRTELAQEIHINTDTPISLTADTDGLTLDKIMYRVDNGEFHEYKGPFTLPVGEYNIEYYSISVGTLVHQASPQKSKRLVVSAREPDKLVNFPNPFKAGKEPTHIEYTTTIATHVKLTIYNLLGQLVWEHSEYHGQAGDQRVDWWGRNSDDFVVSNGGYILILEIVGEGRTIKRKIAVRK